MLQEAISKAFVLAGAPNQTGDIRNRYPLILLRNSKTPTVGNMVVWMLPSSDALVIKLKSEDFPAFGN